MITFIGCKTYHESWDNLCRKNKAYTHIKKFGFSKIRFREQAMRVRAVRAYFLLCGEGEFDLDFSVMDRIRCGDDRKWKGQLQQMREIYQRGKLWDICWDL